MKTVRRTLALMLAFCLCLSALGTGAVAAPAEEESDSAFAAFFESLYIRFWETVDSILGDKDPTVKLNPQCDGQAVRLGTWLWDTDKVASMGDEYLAFLKKNNVNEIYVFGEGIGYNVTAAEVRTFVKKATALGIRCAFMGGEYTWIEPDDKDFARVMQLFEEYQAAAAEDEKFYGIHLDVEPAQHPGYEADSQGVMQKFADFLVKVARPAANRNNTVLEWDIHRFLDEFTVTVNDESINLCELFFRECDSVMLMSYSDEAHGMFKWTEEEFAYAHKYNTPVFMAAETGTLCRDSETYAQEGQRFLVRNMNKVNRQLQKEFEYGEYGLAVHHVSAWYALQNYRLP